MTMPKKAFVTTTPFGTVSEAPLQLLKENNIECLINPLGDTVTLEQSKEFLQAADYIIAGLAKFTPAMLDAAKNLKLVARVGVGLDCIPFPEMKKRQIAVSYTPNALSPAVAEFVIGLIINGQRRITQVNAAMHEGQWNQLMGNLVSGKTIGLIGAGRIGKAVVKLLQPFGATILISDPVEDHAFAKTFGCSYVDNNTIFKTSDIISLHLSSTPAVKHLINNKTIALMKPTAYLINTARGALVNEDDLYEALASGRLAGAALDVFEQEPYQGKLKNLDNAILTSHISSATVESRRLMELTATEEVIRFHRGEPLLYETKG